MEKIQDLLCGIAQQRNVKILYACETGSRAWGFASPDSDYDIRFIYQHDIDWYLSLSNHKDTIEVMDGDWDITGWDLRKSLLLLNKSNAALIERFQSPIEYYTDENFKKGFLELIKHFYSPTAVFFHHYSLAKTFWEELKGVQEVKLKSFFYMVRSLLSCNWIIQNKTVLPMQIDSLMALIDEDIRERLKALIQLKAGVSESYLHPKDPFLYTWVIDMWVYIEKNKENLGVSKNDFSMLDNFFLTTINTNAYGTKS
jgi:uncharacterized protein